MKTINEKKVENLTKDYLLSQYKVVQEKDTLKDQENIIRYEKSISKLNTQERDVFKRYYLTPKKERKDKNFSYTKTAFNKLKTHAELNFLSNYKEDRINTL